MSSELVAVELQLKGYDGVMSDMRALDQMLNSFRGSKNKLELQTNLAQTKKEVLALQGEMNRLNSIKLKLDEQGKSSEGLNNKLKETRERLRDAQQAVKEFQYALKNLTSTTFKQSFNTISSWAAHWGSAMQSMGNALTRLTSPFANFTRGMVMGAGYKALNKFTEGFSNAFERSDILTKYSRNLQMNFDKTEKEADSLRKSLNDAVEGLPTGLDEIVNMANQFTASMGDADKAAKLAIATNNAFLASQSGETDRYQGMMQLRDVIGGKDMNAREWQSLAQSMLPAIRMIGQEMGLTGKELDDYVASVQQGKVANEEFLDQLIKYGTSGKIVETAQLAMDTWEAFFARIGTAASRMGYGVIESLNKIVESRTKGEFKTLNSYLDSIVIPGINSLTESLTHWVDTHPDEIVDFFNSLRAINWKSILRGFGEGIQEVMSLINQFADMLGGRDLSRIGRWMIRGNILGNALTIAGGLIKGSRGLIAGVGATIVKGARTFKNIRRLGGITGWLKTLTLGDGNTGKQALDTVAQASPKMSKFSLGVSKLFKGWAEVATIIGGTALVGWGSMKLLKDTIKTMGDIGEEVKKVDWQSAVPALKWFGIFMGGFLTLGSALGQAGAEAMKPAAIGTAVLGALTTMAAAFADVDMFLVKRTFKHLADATDYLNDAIDNLQKVKDVGDVKDNVRKALESLNEVSNLFRGDFNADTKQYEGGVKHFDKDIADSLGNLSDSLSTIEKSVGIINKLNKTKLEDGNIEDLTSRIGTAMGFISGMFDRMPESMKSGKSSETSGNMKTSLSNFNSSLNSIIGENGILKRIPQILKEMTSLISDGKLSVFETQMARIGDVLTNVFNSLQGIGNGEYFSSNIDGFRTGLKSLKFAIKHLQEISGMEVGNDVVGKIKSIISNIESAFDVGAIGRIQENISTMVTSIKDALKAFEELNGDIEVDVNIKLSSGFDTSVNNVIKKIKDGKDKIKKQNKGISISIPVSVYFSVSSNFGAAIGRIRAWGAQLANAQRGQHPITNGPGQSGGGLRTRNGVLYRSGGGSAFRPRGTDKIPSMLTEGEYVHKKQAVDFFGLDFMRSVNNMDVRGAMNALLTKAGTSVGVGRQSIINHTINNNQRVNMNVTTNNPNFAGARMGRFVGAL